MVMPEVAFAHALVLEVAVIVVPEANGTSNDVHLRIVFAPLCLGTRDNWAMGRC